MVDNNMILNLLVSFIFGIIITLLIYQIRFSCHLFSSTSKLKKEIIIKLIRQIARWSTAALQDKSPVIAVLHANYGAGYLWALKEIMSTDDIENIAKINLKEFEKNVVNIQDSTTRNLAKICPKYAYTKNKYLANIAGEG